MKPNRAERRARRSARKLAQALAVSNESPGQLTAEKLQWMASTLKDSSTQDYYALMSEQTAKEFSEVLAYEPSRWKPVPEYFDETAPFEIGSWEGIRLIESRPVLDDAAKLAQALAYDSVRAPKTATEIAQRSRHWGKSRASAMLAIERQKTLMMSQLMDAMNFSVSPPFVIADDPSVRLADALEVAVTSAPASVSGSRAC